MQGGAGSEGEVRGGDLIESAFRKAGYEVSIQPFTFALWDDPDQVAYPSRNIVALKKATTGAAAPGRRSLVIVGAHYDKVKIGTGADDNASGAGVLVEVAERVARMKTGYDLRFVAFGAEEAGLFGADHFVKRMAAEDVARCVAMVNYDSLLVGDKLYAHAGMRADGSPADTSVREAILRAAERTGQPIVIQQGLNPAYPAGCTPDGFSDYTSFNQAGIPICAFEATNWEIGEYDGWIQTESHGSFWHTGRDRLSTIEALFPGRPMAHLKAYTTVTCEFLREFGD